MYDINFTDILRHSQYDFSELNLREKIDAQTKLLAMAQEALFTLKSIYSKQDGDLRFEDSKVLFDTFIHLQYIIICRAYLIFLSKEPVSFLKCADAFSDMTPNNSFSPLILFFLNYLDQLYVRFNEGVQPSSVRVMDGLHEISSIYKMEGNWLTQIVESLTTKESLIEQVVSCFDHRTQWGSIKALIYCYNVSLFLNIMSIGMKSRRLFFGFSCASILRNFQESCNGLKDIVQYFVQGRNLSILTETKFHWDEFFSAMPSSAVLMPFGDVKNVVISSPTRSLWRDISIGQYDPSSCLKSLQVDFAAILQNTEYDFSSPGTSSAQYNLCKMGELPEAQLAIQLSRFIEGACQQVYSFYMLLSEEPMANKHLSDDQKGRLLNLVFNLQYAVLWRVSLSTFIESAELQMMSKYFAATQEVIPNYPLNEFFAFLVTLYARGANILDPSSLAPIINKTIASFLIGLTQNN